MPLVICGAGGSTKAEIVEQINNNTTENVFNVDSMVDILGIDFTIYKTTNVRGYYNPNDGGGDLFNYDSTIDKSTAEGITIFDPGQTLSNQGSGVGNGAWIRQLKSSVSAEMGGAVGDGITDDYSAILKVKNAFPSFKLTDKQYRIGTDITFDTSPIFTNASLVIDSGITATFNIVPNASREQIFKGDGDVLLNAESSHFAYPEWFGAIANEPATDSGILLQKLSDSVVSGRECEIDFGDGTWYLQTGVIWSRACVIQGSGDRITHFRTTGGLATTGDVFSTADEGVHFKDIQFSSSSIRTSGRYIALLHNYCKALDIWFTDGYQGVQAEGAACVINVVQGFTWSTSVGSFIVSIDGNSCQVDNIRFTGTTSAPKYVVVVGESVDTSINYVHGSGTNIEGVLGLVISSGNIARLIATKIIGSSTIRAVHVLTTVTGGMEDIDINSVIAKSCSGDGVLIDKQGSGILKYLEVSDVKASDCNNGIKTVSSSGTIQHLLMPNVICKDSAVDGITISGTQYFTIAGSQMVSNTGNGIIIDNTSDNFILTSNQSLFNGTALQDNSGAVTKVIQNNIGF